MKCEKIKCPKCRKVREIQAVGNIEDKTCFNCSPERKSVKIKKVKSKKHKRGFQESIEYLLDLLCYSYYCKKGNLVSDITFDELEKLYSKLTGVETAPSRSMEREICYTNGVKAVYDLIKNREKNAK